MNFAENLIKLRRSRNWSQEELGNRLGVTRQTVSKWELGQSTPELEKLVELSRLFQISLDALVGTAAVEPAADAPEAEKKSAAQERCAACGRYRPYYEYISRRKFLGLPLVHIRFSHSGFARATGIIAIGNAAVGVVAVGGCSLGLISLGGISVGLLLSLGGISLGLLAIGGVAVGGFALGGLAVSWWLSIGGCALSNGLAVGTAALGHVAVGESAVGTYSFIKGNGVSAQSAWSVVKREFPHLWDGLRSLIVYALQ